MRKPFAQLIPKFKKGSERERILSGIDYVMKSGGGSLNSRIVLVLKDRKTK